MIFTIIDHKIRGVKPSVTEYQYNRNSNIPRFDEREFPCTDTTLEYVYVGY